jgi:hypothetical protein
MKIYKKILGLVGVALLATASMAPAASLSTVGGTADTVPVNYDPTTPTGVSVGDAITRYQALADGGSVGGGLVLTAVGKTLITITYLGKSAAAETYTIEGVGGGSLSNKDNAVGDSFSFVQLAGGFVDFVFATDSFIPQGVIENGGTSTYRRMNFALTQVIGKSAIALFDDANGGTSPGDRDLDDMVVRIDVQSIPLPAGGLLLLTGLGGLMVARRRKAA